MHSTILDIICTFKTGNSPKKKKKKKRNGGFSLVNPGVWFYIICLTCNKLLQHKLSWAAFCVVLGVKAGKFVTWYENIVAPFL